MEEEMQKVLANLPTTVETPIANNIEQQLEQLRFLLNENHEEEIEEDYKICEQIISKQEALIGQLRETDKLLGEAQMELQRHQHMASFLGIYDLSILRPAADIREKLQNICCVLSFSVDELQMLEPTFLQATLIYNGCNNYLVTFTLDIETNSFDLLDIRPEHKNFNAIKGFLRETNDFVGLLKNVREYFKKISII